MVGSLGTPGPSRISRCAAQLKTRTDTAPLTSYCSGHPALRPSFQTSAGRNHSWRFRRASGLHCLTGQALAPKPLDNPTPTYALMSEPKRHGDGRCWGPSGETVRSEPKNRSVMLPIRELELLNATLAAWYCQTGRENSKDDWVKAPPVEGGLLST